MTKTPSGTVLGQSWWKYTPICMIVLSVFMRKCLISFLLPYGCARDDAERGLFAQVDYGIKNLAADGRLIKVYEREHPGKVPVLIGPETIVLDDDSNIYALTKEAKIVVLENFSSLLDGSSQVVYADIKVLVNYAVGRPLGGKFVPGTKIMYIADAVLGLCRVDLSRAFPKLELVVSQVELANGKNSSILYADDVDVGKSGMVYFSDASNIPPERDPDTTFDTMHSYKLDHLRGQKTGRLLQYNPKTDETVVLADDIWFANGVAVDAVDEKFVLICETSMYRVLKYHLSGTKKGQLDVSLDSLPGYTDGVDCTAAGTCYVAIPSPVIGLSKLLYRLPKSVQAGIKTLIMMLPKQLSPKPIRYGGFLEMKVSSSGDDRKDVMTRIVQDPTGDAIMAITGVTEHKGKLYLGSLENRFIGIYQLD